MKLYVSLVKNYFLRFICKLKVTSFIHSVTSTCLAKFHISRQMVKDLKKIGFWYLEMLKYLIKSYNNDWFCDYNYTERLTRLKSVVKVLVLITYSTKQLNYFWYYVIIEWLIKSPLPWLNTSGAHCAACSVQCVCVCVYTCNWTK